VHAVRHAVLKGPPREVRATLTANILSQYLTVYLLFSFEICAVVSRAQRRCGGWPRALRAPRAPSRGRAFFVRSYICAGGSGSNEARIYERESGSIVGVVRDMAQVRRRAGPLRWSNAGQTQSSAQPARVKRWANARRPPSGRGPDGGDGAAGGVLCRLPPLAVQSCHRLRRRDSTVGLRHHFFTVFGPSSGPRRPVAADGLVACGVCSRCSTGCVFF
jgi:hypothetical protein